MQRVKLIHEKYILHSEFNLFLDWIDKIRIGIWLGQAQLYNRDFKPNFFINQRVGDKDRLCLIYRTDDNEQGISIIGTETEIFEFVPSCFALMINNILIFNYSNNFLISENLGFPYPKEYFYHSNGMISADEIKSGRSVIKMPLLEGKIIKPAIKFYQSILTGDFQLNRPRIGRSKKFINSNSMSFSNRRIKSRIYVSNELINKHGFWKRGEKLVFSFFKNIQ